LCSELVPDVSAPFPLQNPVVVQRPSMPRNSLDLDSFSGLTASQLYSSTLADLLKANVDLEKTFGVSARFAATARAVYEELQDATSTTKDECDLLQMLLCCHVIGVCCDVCCQANESSGHSSSHYHYDDDKKKKQKKKDSSLAEVPTQEVMHEARVNKEPEPSLLEKVSQLSSDDVRKMLHSKGAGKLQKFGMFLFRTKFGEEETKHLQQCAKILKKDGPDLVEKDKLDIDGLVEKSKKGDVKAFAKMMRMAGASLLLKHGQAISEKGLDAIGLSSCAEVLCAGNLKYELDETGLHKCAWACPKDHIPDVFQAIGVDIPADAEDEVSPSMAEAEAVGDKFAKDAELDEKNYEKSSTFSTLKKLHFKFHTAYTEAPLKLLQGNSTTVLGKGLPSAFRYHGKCRPTRLELHERVVFTGSNDKIPHGQLVKVERLPEQSSSKLSSVFGRIKGQKKLGKDEVEVKYKGQPYVVKHADLHREALAKIKVDEGVQEWMHSTGDTIEVSLPALHDPSHKQMKDTLWFPVSSAKNQSKEKEA